MKSKAALTIKMRFRYRLLYLLTNELKLSVSVEDAEITRVSTIQVGKYIHSNPSTTVLNDNQTSV
jgi:hypothetical protein